MKYTHNLVTREILRDLWLRAPLGIDTLHVG